MRQKAFYILALFLIIILQTTFFHRLPAASYGPDLILVVVFTAGFLSGSQTGIAIGFLAGFLQGILLGSGFGLYTISRMLIGAAAGLLKGNVYKESLALLCLILFFVTFFHEILIFLLSEQVILRVGFQTVLVNRLLPASFYNMLVGMLLYILMIYLIPVGGFQDEQKN
ncbi:rod shape-determining protein MreD [Halanaerobiaceae bacterium Z-7014]|uniref:Rod shape-determining protein MreD n=1 Tax=Halonatronomonas betaini TaxID=2778430 RepID=A0A931ANB3_9FIRM|nr:rod shape-determining protein MreD [Halonatronomonas betaini]MBF8435963.1 rod shape-determining protein MreD [Halonatronomonas betaini]